MSKYITFPLDNTDYTADDMALYFSGRTSGVYAGTGELDILSNNDMTVTITPGRAWITPTKYRGIVFASMENVTLPVTMADGLLNRIDRVVIKYDIVENNSLIYVKRGTPATNPTPPILERDSNSAYELAIGEIYIGKGVTLIRPQDITDKRLDSSVCGIVSDGITNVSTTTLENNFNGWFNSSKEIFYNLINSSTEEFVNFMENNGREFSTWFDEIKGILNEDIAGNLATEITKVKEQIQFSNRNTEYGVYFRYNSDLNCLQAEIKEVI